MHSILYYTTNRIGRCEFESNALYSSRKSSFIQNSTACCTALVALLSAVILGNVSSIMLRVYQGTEEQQERQACVREFIRFHKIPNELGMPARPSPGQPSQ